MNITSLKNLLDFKLRKLHNYENMSISEKKDFEDEISSIFPTNLEEIAPIFFKFDAQLKLNFKKSKAVRLLENLLEEAWTIFVFLNIVSSFYKINYSVSNREPQVSLENSYVNSHLFFNRNVEIFQNFFIHLNYELRSEIVKKINVLVQISIKLMIELKIVEERKNYSFVEKNFRPGEFYSKSIISYKMQLHLNFIKNFNVMYKFFYSPLKIIDYRFYVENFKNYEERTLISGPSYIRSEIYEKPNPYNPRSFKSKVKELRDIFSETKFFPDHDFIAHIKKSFWSDLDWKKIEKNKKEIIKELEKTFSENQWDTNLNLKRALLQRQYAKILEDEKTFLFLNNKWTEPYFMSSSHDYRGRKYYCSPLTFTNFKLSRFCFHYGYDGCLEDSYFSWESYNSVFEELSLKINKKIEKNEKEVVGFYLIGMGKLSNLTKQKTETSLEEILHIGLKMFLNAENVLFTSFKNNWLEESLKSKIDVIELECYRFGLRCFLNGDRTKRIILKDATASGYQIQAYLIGCKEPTALKYLNMGSENIFVDTYLFIVDSFIKSQNSLPEWSHKYFKRHIIKKFCMIIPYSAGFDECFKNIENFVVIDEKSAAKDLFKLFYHFIKRELWKELKLNCSYLEHIKYFLNNNQPTVSGNIYYVESETGVADLKYFSSKKKETDTTFLSTSGYKKRTTRKYLSLRNCLDKKQTLTSFAPNIAHFYDSEYIRILHLEPYNLKFASIHDAFIISALDCGKLVYSYGNIFKVKLRFDHRPPITCLM